MSRSYKKHPICKDNNKSKSSGKAQANDAVRSYIKRHMNTDEEFTMPSNKKYIRLYCSWEIADYVTRYSKEQCIQDYYNYQRSQSRWKREIVKDKTLKQWITEWERYYRRK